VSRKTASIAYFAKQYADRVRLLMANMDQATLSERYTIGHVFELHADQRGPERFAIM
jgi:hypothetical protein